jgi:hypothetical protein
VREFQRHFHRYTDVLVAPEDLTRWLALMQHHGAPTRFLDCSYSFWVALFFLGGSLLRQRRGETWRAIGYLGN